MISKILQYIKVDSELLMQLKKQAVKPEGTYSRKR